MRLLTLSLRNFKGRTFTLNANSYNVSVLGDNATGKTSIFDAFTWLLFDKDSQNKKDFKIKNLDVAGNELHNLEHEVEGLFEINDRILTLRKVFTEKWTKKRGSVIAAFDGHTTDYYIDGVPAPKKDYDSRVNEIAMEDNFKLLTSPTYFNEQVHWQDRRRILLSVCGDISDADVIASDKDLAKLPSILNGRKLEDHKKVVVARRGEINKELDKIPVRIDETQRGLPNISAIAPREVIEVEIASLRNQLKSKQQELSRVENGGEVAEKQKAMREIEGRLIDFRNKHRSKNEDKLFAKRNELQKLQLQASGLEGDIRTKESRLTGISNSIKNAKQRRETLIAKWHETNSEQFHSNIETVCPTCEQVLPEERIAEASHRAEAAFNLNKSQRLESINEDGKKVKSYIEELEQEQTALQSEIEKINNAEDILGQTIANLQAEIAAERPVEAVEATAEYQTINRELSAIQEQILAINSQKQSVLRQIQTEIDLFARDITSREKSIAAIEQHERGQLRIKELESQEKALAAEFEKLEGELYLTEQFVRAKVQLLEARINSKFKLARFKLFNQQVNGGLEECCETTYNGVPYSGGLNNAARINVGLDIINTLSEHFGFTAPIFIDNAEAVTELIPTAGQVIRLVVNAKDKVLRVDIGRGQQVNELADLGLFKEAV